MDVERAKQFGQRLRAARTAAALSQAMLAELVECTTETCARAERGVSVPRTETLRKIAEVLGLSFAELVGETPLQVRPKEQLSPELRALVGELRGLDRTTLHAITTVVRLAARGARSHSQSTPKNLASGTRLNQTRKRR